jgi:hypothetical protein
MYPETFAGTSALNLEANMFLLTSHGRDAETNKESAKKTQRVCSCKVFLAELRQDQLGVTGR